MNLVCRELTVPSQAALDALQRRLDSIASSESDVVDNATLPPSLAHLQLGRKYGMYRETIVRVEVRRNGVPGWFDPKTHRGHHGIIEGTFRVYIALGVSAEARAVPTTCESHILPFVEENPEQAELFGSPEGQP